VAVTQLLEVSKNIFSMSVENSNDIQIFFLFGDLLFYPSKKKKGRI
jgi:hypothetical protein